MTCAQRDFDRHSFHRQITRSIGIFDKYCTSQQDQHISLTIIENDKTTFVATSNEEWVYRNTWILKVIQHQVLGWLKGDNINLSIHGVPSVHDHYYRPSVPR